MRALALTLVLSAAIPLSSPQGEPTHDAVVEEHIQQLTNQLPPESLLRRLLQEGVRGNGIHYSWMDEMRGKGINRVVVWVGITFDRRGRPKQMRLTRMQYFSQYDGGEAISDSDRLNAIHASGLEIQLGNLALRRATHASWLDVPRPRPKPFVGGIAIEFFDDEWVPIVPELYTTFVPSNGK